MSDDHSPGDRRRPYSDRGGPEARHAETHDVVREKATNPTGLEPVDESFAEDIAPETPQKVHEKHLEASSGSDDKRVGNSLPELTDDELSRLSILHPGTSLEQGAVYFNLKDRERGPFKAIGGQEAGKSDQIIAKKMTDYEMWNRVTGNPDDVEVERPE